jgi:gluconolactonase
MAAIIATVIVPSAARVEQLATGFRFTEGPVWTRRGELLFSDIPCNTIFRWTQAGAVSEYRKPSGYDGNDAAPGAHIGSNGLTLDAESRVIVCEHGNRRITRIEANDRVTVLTDRYQGKRLNSPNDLVYRSDGTLYFTDPPYGLAGRDKDPRKELPFNGIYCLAGGTLRLLSTELNRPNGLAFSPDEKHLVVANSDPARKIWMRFDVRADGTLENGSVFFDATEAAQPGLPDGMKVDRLGNFYCTGPGGIWILSPEGTHLDTIEFPEVPANCAWGDEDARTLYVTARTSIYRIRLCIPGIRP